MSIEVVVYLAAVEEASHARSKQPLAVQVGEKGSELKVDGTPIASVSTRLIWLNAGSRR